MNFIFLRIFSGFFWLILRFLNDKNNLEMQKKGLYFRAGPTWMRRGMQGHVAAPRGPTWHLRGDVKDADIYIYILYSL